MAQRGRAQARGGLGLGHAAGFQDVAPARGGRGRRGRGAGMVPYAAPVAGGRGAGGRGAGVVPDAEPLRGGRGGRGRGAGGVPDAAPRRLHGQHDPWEGGNVNHKPKPKLTISPCENKVYKVKESELTGNVATDELIRNYVASFNNIQRERIAYIELKIDGADRRELEGQFKFIQKLVKNSKKLQRPIEQAGGIPRDHPPHLSTPN